MIGQYSFENEYMLLKYAISASFSSSWGHSTDAEHENLHSSLFTSFCNDKFRDNSHLKFKEIHLCNRQKKETGIEQSAQHTASVKWNAKRRWQSAKIKWKKSTEHFKSKEADDYIYYYKTTKRRMA